MQFLVDNGFPVYNYSKLLNNFDDIKTEIQKIDIEKKNLDILIDGTVLKLNNIELRNDIGYTSKFPK